jgi:hypothetical protein
MSLLGTVFATAGDEIHVGGGLVGESPSHVGFAEKLIGEPIPDGCRTDGLSAVNVDFESNDVCFVEGPHPSGI